MFFGSPLPFLNFMPLPGNFIIGENYIFLKLNSMAARRKTRLAKSLVGPQIMFSDASEKLKVLIFCLNLRDLHNITEF